MFSVVERHRTLIVAFFSNMRGPGLHISPDIRRLWRCPACGRERMVGQTETTVVCRCQDPPKFMQLVEGKRVVRPEPRPVAHFYEEDELPPDEFEPAAPGDPTVQSVIPPRPPRPPRPQGEQQGERPRQGDQRPQRDKGRPQDRPRGPGGQGGQGPRPPKPTAGPAPSQQAPASPVVESPDPGSSAAATGDRPKKKRRRNRDRNRDEGTQAPAGQTMNNAPAPPDSLSPPPQQDDFGAGL